jgi:hypothetical protein
MSKDDRLDLLVDKVKKGILFAHKQFLKEAKKQNQKLVVMRNNKVVLINARDIK